MTREGRGRLPGSLALVAGPGSRFLPWYPVPRMASPRLSGVPWAASALLQTWRAPQSWEGRRPRRPSGILGLGEESDMEREGAKLLQSPSMATPPQGQFSARLASHVRGCHLAPPNHPALASAGISPGREATQLPLPAPQGALLLLCESVLTAPHTLPSSGVIVLTVEVGAPRTEVAMVTAELRSNLLLDCAPPP